MIDTKEQAVAVPMRESRPCCICEPLLRAGPQARYSTVLARVRGAGRGHGVAVIYVVVASVGRAQLTRETIDLLARQTRQPDHVIVVSVSAKDVEGVADSAVEPEVIFTGRGLCRQRNAALDLISDRADIVTFFDDDFVAAPDYLEQVERLFASDPNIVGITGDLLADGINNSGYSVKQALAIVEARPVDFEPALRKRLALYGCNMSIRLSAATDLRFDEALPLYGWQEDIDFTYQVGQRGRLVSTHAVTGVHMGVKGGRTSGKKVGYSQIANVIYLKRKGTMQPGLGERLMFANLTSNLVRSLWSEPHVDRRGRLWGNALAIADLFRGRLDPRKIERM